MIDVKVWGNYACFTRPEHKVERVTYDVMTPSAARGILEAISWKPQFKWRVREIKVLNPIKHMGITRNEIKEVVTPKTARALQPEGKDGLIITEHRTQRHSLILKDVAYIIRAEVEVRDHATERGQTKAELRNKYESIFQRRVERGQGFSQPYFGTREFAAYFSPPTGDETPVDITANLGRMLFDLKYAPSKKGTVTYAHHYNDGVDWIDGYAEAKFFEAKLDKGVMLIPDLYDEAGE